MRDLVKGMPPPTWGDVMKAGSILVGFVVSLVYMQASLGAVQRDQLNTSKQLEAFVRIDVQAARDEAMRGQLQAILEQLARIDRRLDSQGKP